MTNTKPMFEIIDTISLEGLGYDKGSEAVVNINFTRSWLLKWAEAHNTKKDEGESLADWIDRKNAPIYELAAQMIKRVVVMRGDSRYEQEVTSNVIREIDTEIDSELMQFIIDEAQERSAARVVNAATTFRQQRTRLLDGGKEGKRKATSASDKPIVNSEIVE